MPNEIALFWLVAAGFFLFDNLVFVPAGHDMLRFGRKGRLRYSAHKRLEASGREVVLLNPLNLFDRGVLTTHCLGDLRPAAWRTGQRQVRRALPALNAFSWLGSTYLVIALVLAWASFRTDFSLCLLALILAHAVFWLIGLGLLLRRRHDLHLSGHEVFVFAAEALFVPAYLMNMGRRLVSRKQLDMPALGVGLHQLKRLAVGSVQRELLVYQLRERLATLETNLGLELDDTPTSSAHSQQQQWIQKARSCLTG